MARSRKKAKGRAITGRFIALPVNLVESKEFRSLKGSDLKILIGLMYQYRGNNNGDLSAPHTMAKVWGVGSKTTLADGHRTADAVRSDYSHSRRLLPQSGWALRSLCACMASY